MKADEMFKKLGYEKKCESKFGIVYKKGKDNINFIKRVNLVSCVRYVFAENEGVHIQNSFPINMEELQAINEKCKELRWLNEHQENNIQM